MTEDKKQTTYKFKDKEGKPHSEQIETDRKTGNTKHTIDGQEVKPQGVPYIPSNYERHMITMTNKIYDLMKEMNYYLSFLATLLGAGMLIKNNCYPRDHCRSVFCAGPLKS